jgi:hypothetical protein
LNLQHKVKKKEKNMKAKKYIHETIIFK